MIGIIAAAMKRRMVFLLIAPLKLRLTHLQLPSVDMNQNLAKQTAQREVAGRARAPVLAGEVMA
jgi:hypothetical protein